MVKSMMMEQKLDLICALLETLNKQPPVSDSCRHKMAEAFGLSYEDGMRAGMSHTIAIEHARAVGLLNFKSKTAKCRKPARNFS